MFYCFRPADVFDASPRVLRGHFSVEAPTASEDTPLTSFSSGTVRHATADSRSGSASKSPPSAPSPTANRLSISFHPDDRCTLTLTGGALHSSPVAAYATSLSFLQGQPMFSISQKCNCGITSVAVKFPTEVLEAIPLLQDAFRSRPATHGDETLTSQIELGAGVHVWALLDLLACVAAAWQRGPAGTRERVRGLLQKSMLGKNPGALADLRLMAGYMMCEEPFQVALEVVAQELQAASARQRKRPLEVDRDMLSANINRLQHPQSSTRPLMLRCTLPVLWAFTSRRVPVCERQVLAACAPRCDGSPPAVRPALWPISSCTLFARDITDLDISSALTFAEFSHLAYNFRHMPLRRLSIKLPLSAHRRAVVGALQDPRFAHVPGRSPAGAVDVTDVEVLAKVAAADGLPRLEHLGVVDSALHETCMQSLMLLCSAVADTLTSLDLTEAAPLSHSHLRGFELAIRQPYSNRSAAPWECLSLLRMLRVLCVGQQTAASMREFTTCSAAVPSLPGLDRLELIVMDRSGDEDAARLQWFGLRDEDTIMSYAERVTKHREVSVFAVDNPAH
eukprot:jgi/Ulvmu1/3336/UM155_0019.1